MLVDAKVLRFLTERRIGKTIPLCGICLFLFPQLLLAENTPPPKAARSVHLWYPAPDAFIFYNEMTVLASTPGSYFMACGWNTGYFGVQELVDGSKVVLFSVWDPTQGNDPRAVDLKDRVECLHSDQHMKIKRFGGEGTGGQCLGAFDWTVGVPVHFAVQAVLQGEKTSYTGYIRANGSETWRRLVTFRTRTGGTPLKGLYSFIEDFRRDGRSAKEKRRAAFGNAWVKTVEGTWSPLTETRFTASNATWEAKDTINASVWEDLFHLETGGKTIHTTRLQSVLKLKKKSPPTPPKLDIENHTGSP